MRRRSVWVRFEPGRPRAFSRLLARTVVGLPSPGPTRHTSTFRGLSHLISVRRLKEQHGRNDHRRDVPQTGTSSMLKATRSGLLDRYASMTGPVSQPEFLGQQHDKRQPRVQCAGWTA